MPDATDVHREVLADTAGFRLHRGGRFLVADLKVPHRVLSTSVVNGGMQDGLAHLLNHQSCEAAGHLERHDALHGEGLEAYHARTCREAGLDAARASLMGTAANMHYASVVALASTDVGVTAVVTAGVSGNAACAADPTVWSEGLEGFRRVATYEGTINTMVLVDRCLAPQALAAAAVVLAEGKAAALQRLAVRSRYSGDYATGTTTDQFCIACRADGTPLTSASTGVKLGELIGRAVRDATLEALRWQNGLEPSYARSLFHALAACGVKEETFLAEMAPLLAEPKHRLLQANLKAVVYEPLVAAAAFAMAAVLDRLRHGVLPAGAAREAIRHQAASMAAALAARSDLWGRFHRELGEVEVERPAACILRALALGWNAKWE